MRDTGSRVVAVPNPQQTRPVQNQPVSTTCSMIIFDFVVHSYRPDVALLLYGIWLILSDRIWRPYAQGSKGKRKSKREEPDEPKEPVQDPKWVNVQYCHLWLILIWWWLALSNAGKRTRLRWHWLGYPCSGRLRSAIQLTLYVALSSITLYQIFQRRGCQCPSNDVLCIIMSIIFYIRFIFGVCRAANGYYSVM